MKHNDSPIVKDLVLIGGGHAHVAVLRRFGMRPLPGVRLTLIGKDVMTPYSGMLPGLIAGHYRFEQTHIDLGRLARFAGARFYHNRAVALDLATRRVHCTGRPPLPYDLLSIDIGSAPATGEVPGATDFTTPVKPIDRFVDHWAQMQQRVLARERPSRIGVVGGGAGGVEILLAIQYRLRALLAEQGRASLAPQLHLFTDSEEILPSHNRHVRRRMAQILERRGVTCHTGHRVTAVEPGRLRCANGYQLELDEILWVTWAGAASWVAESGVAVDERGFIQVNDSLQSISHPELFAAGDIATMINHPRPKAGVFAVRQGAPLTENLRRALRGQTLRPYRPQRHFLSLLSSGDRHAIASRAGWALQGDWIWRWKDRIDRRFMARFQELPEMKEEPRSVLPAQRSAALAAPSTLAELANLSMRCGGCGAKVGSSVLSRALSQIEPLERAEVVVGLRAPDDAAVVALPAGKVMVHTVDHFRALIDDPYLLGKIAANHALGDIFAMGAEPQTALAIVTLPYGVESKLEESLAQLMAGANEQLKAAGAALVGGHTGEGAELAIGFAINGLADREQLLSKGGMRPGDQLLLTKPIGTGTLFAADMRHRAAGPWIQAALASMQHSNQTAARLLLRHGASACSDVTGFGLLGHLIEMIKPAAVEVSLDLAAIPLLDGALECIAMGITSSLQPQNLHQRHAIRDLEQVVGDPRYPLLFDPQTAGGLLAALPADAAERCVDELRAAGYPHATLIGEVHAGSGALERIRLRTITTELQSSAIPH